MGGSFAELTLEVNPPRSGVFNICFSVLTNRGSDWKRKPISDTTGKYAKHASVLTTHALHEKYKGHNEHRRVQYVGFLIALAEMFQLRIPSLLHNLFVEVISGGKPFSTPGAR